MGKLLNEARKDNIYSNIQAIQYIISTMEDIDTKTKDDILMKLDEVKKILNLS